MLVFIFRNYMCVLRVILVIDVVVVLVVVLVVVVIVEYNAKIFFPLLLQKIHPAIKCQIDKVDLVVAANELKTTMNPLILSLLSS